MSCTKSFLMSWFLGMCVFDTYVQLFVVSVFVGFSAIEELEMTRWVKYGLHKHGDLNFIPLTHIIKSQHRSGVC